MNLASFYPEMVLLAGASTILLLSVFRFPLRKYVLGLLAILAVAISFVVMQTVPGVREPAGNLFVQNDFSNFARGLLLVISVPILLSSLDMFNDASKRQGEFVFLMLISVTGLMLLVQSSHMLSLYLGIELASIPLYMMAGLKLHDPTSKEAVVKYFLLGAFASAMTIYGISLIYTTAGTFSFVELFNNIKGTPLEMVGFIFVLAGLSFKVAAVPFHFWAPDVYEGSPPVSTAFISVAPKIGALIVLSRFVSMGINPASSSDFINLVKWSVAGISALSMTYGNLAAIWQTEVKRIMAYSSIAQIGYMLIGIAVMAFSSDAAIRSEGARGILMYVTAYALMNIAVFSIIKVVKIRRGGTTLNHFKGLSKTDPGLALAMTISLVSLLGIPFAAGFFGKLLVFTAGVSAGLYWLVILAIINSAISAFYYFGIAKNMYLEAPDQEYLEAKPAFSFAYLVAVVCSVSTLVIGLLPWIYQLIAKASESL
ncbi:MAG: NADH-quinone oxidoreductase subunit N [Caldisericales bacterium]|nr:NADH-quinone oxidoreductase subunit N [Caldisericales bacterium]